MATEVTLPALGESVTEGTVTSWLKSVGDQVAVDEPLLEVSTDKVDTEIPSPAAGTLLEIKAQEDETVEVGAVLALIGADEESSGGPAPESSAPAGEATSTASDDANDVAAGDLGEAGEVGSSTQESSPGAAPSDPETDEGASDLAPSEQAPAARADVQPEAGGDAASGQASEVTLPALGESVTEGTVTSWLKSVGDEVAVDEPLLEVSTDKVDTEIPSPVAGRLQEIRVAEDETVEVGAVLAVIGSGAPASAGAETSQSSNEQPADAGSASAPTAQADAPESSAAESAASSDVVQAEPQPQADALPTPDSTQPTEQPAAQAAPPPSPSAAVHAESDGDGSGDGDGGPGGGKAYVTPLVRKLAAQHEVKLESLTGSGVGGRIRKQDVLQAAEAAKQSAKQSEEAESPAAAPAPSAPAAAAPAAQSPLRGKTEKLSRLRRVIAARMVESLQTSAQLTTVVEVDVTSISRLRDRVKSGFEQREGVKLSFLPFFAKAAVDALKTYPQVNASIDTDAGEVTYHDAEHLGVAVDTERGLLVPVIKDAGDLSIAGLARKIADLAARTRENKVTPDELSGGTFTLTNTGSRGALFDTPIINQPQVAILGTGTVVKRPVVIDDPNLGETIAVRQMVYLALTYDHRLVDGADAARFLTAIKQRLEEAQFESELGV
jgi:pyruvate dehydrogenase E2 component (dihydrolipoyllysine-residue acetyltransferase)